MSQQNLPYYDAVEPVCFQSDIQTICLLQFMTCLYCSIICL